MMREDGRTPVCSLCLDYVTGLCTDEQKLAFERHLPECADCRTELDELRTVWEVLPANMERFEPPKDLKQQVMQAALAAEPALIDDLPIRSSRRFTWKHSTAAVAAVLAIVIAGSIWNYRIYQKREALAVMPFEQAVTLPAARVERLVSLKPQNDKTADSYGVACVVGNGQSKQFIVYLFKAPETTGNEAYQVWLLRDNNRRSAGTFRVSGDGVGVLSIPVSSDDSIAFDTIGITLEPDDRGNQPRGAKMFGTSL